MNSHHLVTRLELGTLPGRDDGPGVLVTQHARHGDLGVTALERLEISSTSCSRNNLDENVARPDLRNGGALNRHLSWSLQNQGIHRIN